MNRDYITVAEYAELRGISAQAVYKALKGKLKNYGSSVVIDGKPQKVLSLSVLSPDEYARFAPHLVDRVNEEKYKNQPTIEQPIEPEATGDTAGLYAALLEERGRRVADLENRVRDLVQLVAEQRAELAEKDKCIQAQSEKLSELLSAALQLQPGNLLLMGAASRAGAQEAQSAEGSTANYTDMTDGAQAVQAEPAAPAVQNRGFWARLFGNK